MTFGYIDAASIAAWSALIFWQPCLRSSPKDGYKMLESKLSFAPPAWIFSLVWALLYSMLVVAIVFFTKYAAQDSWELIAGTVLFVVHVLATKMWSIAFWDWNRPVVALVLLLGVMIPTLVVFIVACCLGAMSDFFYIPVIMSSIYMAWLVFAAVLNGYAVSMRRKSKQSTQ